MLNSLYALVGNNKNYLSIWTNSWDIYEFVYAMRLVQIVRYFIVFSLQRRKHHNALLNSLPGQEGKMLAATPTTVSEGMCCIESPILVSVLNAEHTGNSLRNYPETSTVWLTRVDRETSSSQDIRCVHVWLQHSSLRALPRMGGKKSSYWF